MHTQAIEAHKGACCIHDQTIDRRGIVQMSQGDVREVSG
jgi:hypothetical protein